MNEGVTLSRRKRPIESPLEANRRGWLPAETPAADRTRKRPGPDLDVIRQGAQSNRALEERVGARLGAGRELRPPHVADHQCMSGQDEPRLGGSRAIADEQRHVLRRVTRRVKNANGDIADGQILPVPQPAVFGPVNGLVHEIGRTGGRRERAATRAMIRVHVRINHVDDAHPGLATGVEISSDVLDRIDDHALAVAAAAEEIRHADRHGVQELSEDHLALALARMYAAAVDSSNEMIESL